MPISDEEAYISEHVSVSPASECLSCHEEDLSEFDYDYHASASIMGRYAIWMDYFESPEPWWVTVPSHEDENSISVNRDDSSVRANYGRRTNLNSENSTLSGSTYVGSSGGSSSGIQTGDLSGDSTRAANTGSTRSDKSKNDGALRKTKTDNSLRDNSGRKTNKK